MYSSMKKILYFIPVLLMAVSCDWFEFDNMEGYDATITGKFIDAGTNDPVMLGVGSGDSYSFTIYEENFVPEKGTFSPSAQTWYARTNGTYTNNLVFAGDYRIQTLTSSYYPITEQFSIKKGSNTHDFKVTPYARVKNVNITYDAAAKQLVAKCTVEHGDASKTNGIRVFFMGAQDRFVGKAHNNFKDATASTGFGEPGNYELRVNVTGGNNNEFKYSQPHYVRIGVMATHCSVVPAWDEDTVDMDKFPWGELASDFSNWNDLIAKTPHKTIHHPAEYKSDGTVNPNEMYNYSAVYKVSADFSTITEVTDWE